METKTMTAKTNAVACQDESLADKASARLAGVADKVGHAASEAHDKIAKKASQSGHRLQETAQKVGNAARELATEALHSAQGDGPKGGRPCQGSGGDRPSTTAKSSPASPTAGEKPAEVRWPLSPTARSRRQRLLFWGLSVVGGLQVAYLVAANLLLKTGLLRAAVSGSSMPFAISGGTSDLRLDYGQRLLLAARQSARRKSRHARPR